MQVYNPYLPSYEYIPDGEPYVFDGRLYVYGSHDKFGGQRFCENDYVCWSAPVDNLADWRCEGVIYRKTWDPMNADGSSCLYAPDVQRGPDGRYYLYYALDKLGIMSVAVCDSPAGDFAYYGCVRHADGQPVGANPGDIFQFDPGIFMDDDGRVYLYSGFAPRAGWIDPQTFGGRRTEGAYCMELEPDMLTVKAGPELVVPGPELSQGAGFDSHAFFEASSLRKIGGRYYFIYSSINSHELCYATGEQPDGPFTFGGTLVSNGDVFLNGRTVEKAVGYMGNNHGSLVQVGGQWYVFYHRQTNRHGFSRQGCAEPIVIDAEGRIRQVEMTSCGLNGGPLAGHGRYEAYIACNLYYKGSAGFYGSTAYDEHPYLTQTGEDREGAPDQHIANMRHGAVAGFKYFDLRGTTGISVEARGTAQGTLTVLSGPAGDVLARIPICAGEEHGVFSAGLDSPDGVSALFFLYEGEGAMDFRAFTLH